MNFDFILGMILTYVAMFYGAVLEHFDNKRRLKVLELEKELKQNE